MTSRAQDRRAWLGGGGAVALLIVVVAWFAVISPKLSSAQTLRDQTSAAESERIVLQAKITKLRLQRAQGQALTASLQAGLAALPFDTGLPAYTRQLTRQAKANRVVVSSISVAAVSAIASTSNPAGATDTAPAPGTATTGATSSGTLLGIPITVVSTGKGIDQRAFLKAIQVTGPRRALVASSQLTPAAGGQSIEGAATMTTQLKIFTAPLTPPALAQLQKLLHGDLSN